MELNNITLDAAIAAGASKIAWKRANEAAFYVPHPTASGERIHVMDFVDLYAPFVAGAIDRGIGRVSRIIIDADAAQAYSTGYHQYAYGAEVCHGLRLWGVDPTDFATDELAAGD
jgi:hypothetical protein